MPALETFWNELFAEPSAGALRTLRMRQVFKGGRPWLLLPASARMAARVLDLYPAQLLRARLARAGLRCVLSARLPLGFRPATVSIPLEGEFTRFLAGVCGQGIAELPRFGVLAGNAATPGQRFILLLFDVQDRPVAVVKAGLSDHARELVGREEKFLSAVPASSPGIPRLRATFEGPGRRAFALDFFAGPSPKTEDREILPRLLRSWVDTNRQIPIAQTRPWRELKGVCLQNPVFAAVSKKLDTRTVAAAIAHGDLAPWNIKVLANGDWMALDWERGDLEGLPSWDWFRYVIQPAILVRRGTAMATADRLERLLGEAAFQDYARLAGIAGLERELALACLLHHNEVIRPSEGRDQGRALLETLAKRWSSRG
jgi:hypothetical protein